MVALVGERLFSGLYINQLVSRLLHDHVKHLRLFATFVKTLADMANTEPLEGVLRRFELELLADLGYAIKLATESRKQQPIAANKTYGYLPDIGFEEASTDTNDSKRIFSGAHLLDLARLELKDSKTAASAKHLVRKALEVHLGGKSLHSRKLFT